MEDSKYQAYLDSRLQKLNELAKKLNYSGKNALSFDVYKEEHPSAFKSFRHEAAKGALIGAGIGAVMPLWADLETGGIVLSTGSKGSFKFLAYSSLAGAALGALLSAYMAPHSEKEKALFKYESYLKDIDSSPLKKAIRAHETDHSHVKRLQETNQLQPQVVVER